MKTSVLGLVLRFRLIIDTQRLELGSNGVFTRADEADQACVPKNLQLLAYLGADVLVLWMK